MNVSLTGNERFAISNRYHGSAPSDPAETLRHYAARLAGELRIDGPFDLGGSSFGGMVALELARHLSPQHVFLFGSMLVLPPPSPRESRDHPSTIHVRSWGEGPRRTHLF